MGRKSKAQIECEQRETIRAAMTPAQRAEEKEKSDEFGRGLVRHMTDLLASVDTETPLSSLPQEITARPFADHMTEAGRIHARSLGILLD